MPHRADTSEALRRRLIELAEDCDRLTPDVLVRELKQLANAVVLKYHLPRRKAKDRRLRAAEK